MGDEDGVAGIARGVVDRYPAEAGVGEQPPGRLLAEGGAEAVFREITSFSAICR
jgi:hypothetical protein